jgi:hypothetical protein
MPFLLRIALHQRVEDPDLARRPVVDHRAVEQRDHRIGSREPLPVLREDRRRLRVRQRERVHVRDEDLDALSAQRAAHSSMNDRS